MILMILMIFEIFEVLEAKLEILDLQATNLQATVLSLHVAILVISGHIVLVFAEMKDTRLL